MAEQQEQQFDYYAPRPLGGGAPIGLFRVPKDDGGPPQQFDPGGRCWVNDKWLRLKLMSGDVGPPDQISFEEAKLLFAALISQPLRGSSGSHVRN